MAGVGVELDEKGLEAAAEAIPHQAKTGTHLDRHYIAHAAVRAYLSSSLVDPTPNNSKDRQAVGVGPVDDRGAERRWTIFVCPQCHKIPLDENMAEQGVCYHGEVGYRVVPVVVVPAPSGEGLREALAVDEVADVLRRAVAFANAGTTDYCKLRTVDVQGLIARLERALSGGESSE